MSRQLPAKGRPGFVLMDDDDARAFEGQELRLYDGYVSLKDRRKLVARLILGAVAGQCVGYRSENKHDLRRTNIYLTTRAAIRRRDAARATMRYSTGFVGVRYVERKRGHVFITVVRKVTPEARNSTVYNRTFTDVYEAALAYNRVTQLVQGARRGVNRIPDDEVRRIYQKWGSDIPPGYRPPSDPTQDVVACAEPGTRARGVPTR